MLSSGGSFTGTSLDVSPWVALADEAVVEALPNRDMFRLLFELCAGVGVDLSLTGAVRLPEIGSRVLRPGRPAMMVSIADVGKGERGDAYL